MKKKVWVEDLSLGEILERLDKGEKVYVYGCNEKVYVQKVSGFLISFFEDGTFTIGSTVMRSEHSYFLDDTPEPEADESCIGKLCKFRDTDAGVEVISVLTRIDNEMSYKYYSRESNYAHCTPLTAEEVKQYIKEK